MRYGRREAGTVINNGTSLEIPPKRALHVPADHKNEIAPAALLL